MYFETGSSSLILPSSTSFIATTVVIALVIENRRKIVLSVIGALETVSCTPKNFVIDRLAVLLDQHDGAGNLAGRHLVLEELADLGELVRIEMRAGGIS